AKPPRRPAAVELQAVKLNRWCCSANAYRLLEAFMIRILIALAALGALASCTQYREPQANCFSFLASTAATAQDCHFAPLGAPEGDVEV
ncbi:hypothetical protein, partial [Profundibacterium mesophilum]